MDIGVVVGVDFVAVDVVVVDAVADAVVLIVVVAAGVVFSEYGPYWQMNVWPRLINSKSSQG